MSLQVLSSQLALSSFTFSWGGRRLIRSLFKTKVCGQWEERWVGGTLYLDLYRALSKVASIDRFLTCGILSFK